MRSHGIFLCALSLLRTIPMRPRMISEAAWRLACWFWYPGYPLFYRSCPWVQMGRLCGKKQVPGGCYYDGRRCSDYGRYHCAWRMKMVVRHGSSVKENYDRTWSARVMQVLMDNTRSVYICPLICVIHVPVFVDISKTQGLDSIWYEKNVQLEPLKDWSKARF